MKDDCIKSPKGYVTFALSLATTLATATPMWAQNPEVAWQRSLGPGSVIGLAVDTDFSLLIGGMMATGSVDTFVRKLDSGGGPLWSVTFDSGDFDTGGRLKIDSTGDCYLVGNTLGNLGRPNPGQGDHWDPYLAKIDLSGNVLWIRQFGSDVDDISLGIALDFAGNAYVHGHTWGELGDSLSGESRVFVAKFDSEGNMEWLTQFAAPPIQGPEVGGCMAGDIACDHDGGTYITGNTTSEAFLAQLNAAGALSWMRPIPEARFAQGLAVAANGEVVVALSAGDCLEGGALVGKYDRFGNAIWVRLLEAEPSTAWDVALDPLGNAYVSGSSGVVFAKCLDAGGDLLWTTTLPPTVGAESLAIALDPAGDIYLATRTDNWHQGLSSSGESWLVKLRNPLQFGMMIGFDAAELSVSERAGHVAITVRRNNGGTAAASVDYASKDGSARAGRDYIAVAGTLAFAAGEMTKSIRVPIFSDRIREGDETFQLILSNPQGGTLGAQRTTRILLQDDTRRRPMSRWWLRPPQP